MAAMKQQREENGVAIVMAYGISNMAGIIMW
jgi:hypothetical protein